jgi:hypothetical protein
MLSNASLDEIEARIEKADKQVAIHGNMKVPELLTLVESVRSLQEEEQREN